LITAVKIKLEHFVIFNTAEHESVRKSNMKCLYVVEMFGNRTVMVETLLDDDDDQGQRVP